MKSKFFRSSKTFTDSHDLESIQDDLAAMLSISSDKITAFVRAVGEILNASISERGRIAQAAIAQVGVEQSIFDHACNVAGWLATEFFPHGTANADTPEDIVDDMITLEMMPEDQRSTCVAFVSAIKFMVQREMWSEVEKDRALQKGAPKVVGVETALFFRNVFRKGLSSD